jgi:hypothetical protein
MTDLQTLVVEIHYHDGRPSLKPIYECHSVEKFDEFVAWHRANLTMRTTTVLKAYDSKGGMPVLTEIVIK